MNYVLYKLAPGSYDLELDGELIGGVVRTLGPATTWTAELLEPYRRASARSPSRTWSTSSGRSMPF